MNCEILFRGKRVDNGEWVYGYFVKYQPCASKDEWIVGIVPEYASALYIIEVDIETVGRYTDLTDKNGKKIFEGDILRRCSGTIHEVVFEQRNGSAFFGWKMDEDATWNFDVDFLRQLEIIGNIHDNPELLEEG